MADDRSGTADGEARTYWAWTELFRTFQVALDPKKLALAAAGIAAMWLGWLALSAAFAGARSEPKLSSYETAAYQKKYDLDEAEARKRAEADFVRDHADYVTFYRLAGPGTDEAGAEAWKKNT